MSSEEKEPYFDGPLVTPPSAQQLFYPGPNPQHNFGQAAGFQHQPGPAFYNPNDFVQGSGQPISWEAPIPNQQPQLPNMNQVQNENINSDIPVAQAYFGGVDTSSSGTSSQQTSPEHVPQSKVAELPFNQEPQMYSSNPMGFVAPQVDGAVSQSQMFNPGSLEAASNFTLPEVKMHNPTLPPGGASGQHGFAHPPASSLFMPSMGHTNPEIHNYMNPVPNDIQQTSCPPDANKLDILQPASLERNADAGDEVEDGGLLNPIDLHNGAPTQNDLGNDRSYMNMAYNPDYSGMAPPQRTNVNSFVGREFNIEAPSVMVQPSSGHDYDILHSQGTWEEQNYTAGGLNGIRSHPLPVKAADVPPLEDFSAHILGEPMKENQVVDEQAAAILSPASGDGSQLSDVQDKPPALEDAPITIGSSQPSSSADSQMRGAESLYDPTVEDQIPPSDVENKDGLQDLVLEAKPEADPEGLHTPAQPTGDTMLSLDYNNGSSLNNSQNLQGAHGPSISAAESNPSQQSYSVQLPDLGASVMLQPDVTQQEQSPLASLSENQPESSLNVAKYEDVAEISVENNPESPIPADGLHPKQSAPEPHFSESPHHFASPNSAFESRIRSQSTGSNNSNASSHRSATNQPLRNVQNRITLPPYSAASMDIPSSSRQEPPPVSNPFSTNTMHSSHVSDHSPSRPLTTAPPLQPAIPPIPDIVRPLPSGSGDENLRTGATVPYSSSNQSLHSQVLRDRTAYPPEPVPPPQPATVSAYNRPQPDLIQSPPETVSGVQLRTSAEAPHTVMALKTSVPQSLHRPDVNSTPTTAGQTASVSSDPYLSRSLHNSNSDMAPPNIRSRDPVPQLSPVVQSQPSENEQSPESSLPASARMVDVHQRDVDDHYHAEPRRRDEDSRYGEERERSYRRTADDNDSRRGSRDPRWDDYRRDSEEYRRDYDGRYRDSGDDRYKDTRYDDPSRSRSEHNSRPSSRQGTQADYYSRHYDDRYDRDYRDPYYRDRYYTDRYSAYDRPYYRYDDRAPDRYYDSYYARYHQSWQERNRQYYDQYYQDSYYRDRDYRTQDQRRPDEEDSRSVYSERSRVTELDQSASEREWFSRHSFYGQYENGYGHGYDPRYYEDSLADEPTLSNAYDESWQKLPQVQSRQTPVKFSSAHTVVRFGPGGQLIKVQPNRPADNQPSIVEIHSLEILLQNTPEAEDLRSYPGPLTKDDTHKNDVLQFSSAHSVESMKDVELIDRRSTALIWDFLALLVRQNGSVLGTDIAELLTRDHSGDFTFLQSPLEASRQRQLLLQQRTATPNSISDEQGGSASPAPDPLETKSTVSTLSAEVAPTMERNTNRFRELLLHGRKKDALEWAMKSGLWGHALLLASKTDSRTHAQVMLRFANSLPINDPLQTVYQLMSGRQPAAATCVSEEGWGDWRPHLAMMLSNPTSSASLDMRAVLTMGDTLSTRGLLHAAHFCYLMSSTPLGYYGRTASKMVLLGGNHLLPFKEFASFDSIRRTEIYEYAISLGKPQKSGSNSSPAAVPAFQLYKLIYACKLAEYGMVTQAFHYCERIAKAVCRSPSSYSSTMVNQLLNISDQLRYHDPQIQAGVTEASSLRWVETLRTINSQIQSGAIVPRAKPSSLLTVSNSPSVVSTSPTNDSQTDEIQFSAHTPDQDDIDDVLDSGRMPPPAPVNEESYGLGAPPVTMYSPDMPAAPVTSSLQPRMPEMGGDQQIHQPYNQEQSRIPTQDLKPPSMHYNQQHPHLMQPSVQTYAQQQVPMGDFNQLSNQANPLAQGFAPPPVPYQQPNAYGYTKEQQQPPLTLAEEAEKTDHYDYYDKMANANKFSYGNSASLRSRTISQSSQHSRGSTIKGYDRTTPTGMFNNTDKGRRSRTTSENSAGRRSRKTSDEAHANQQNTKEELEEPGVKKTASWSLFGWLSRRRSNQVHLPDDSNKEIVWDNDKQRWVNKNATEEETAPPAPPPMDSALGHPASQPAPQQPAMNQNGSASLPLMPNSGDGQLTANRFSLKNLGKGSMYKNAFSTSSKPVAAPGPADLLPGLQNPVPAQTSGFMIPNPAPTSQPTNFHDGDPTRSSTPPMHAPDAAQSIQNPTVAPAPESNVPPPTGPTMFFNPAQFSAQPDLLTQPNSLSQRGNALNRRGRSRVGFSARR